MRGPAVPPDPEAGVPSGEEYDAWERRCPMLGHAVTFSYCRSCAGDLPCRRICDCWFASFDVVSYVKEHFSGEDIRRFTSPPRDKRVELYELILRARERAGPGSRGDKS